VTTRATRTRLRSWASHNDTGRRPAYRQKVCRLKGRQCELGDDHPDTLESMNDLAILYKEQARYDEAEQLLLKAVEGRRLKLGDTHPFTLESWHNLIELYEAWGKPEKAKEW
jgi:tetratricopeptide (TPR) repeat protein